MDKPRIVIDPSSVQDKSAKGVSAMSYGLRP